MDINALREDLAQLAAMLDPDGFTARTVRETRDQLLRLTPQWHAMPTVEEVRARDIKAWLCQGAHRVRIHDLTVVDGVVCGVDLEGRLYGFTNAAECGWWPCDSDGIREPSWVTT